MDITYFLLWFAIESWVNHIAALTIIYDINNMLTKCSASRYSVWMAIWYDTVTISQL